MLEHIPHFRLEKTLAEFNRLLKVGGTIRIVVPDMKRAATAYVNGDKEYFASSKRYSDDLGIGGSFLRVVISPGGQTLAISREMDEILGGYAHLIGFDFEMLEKLLGKWGFGEIVESQAGESSIEELRERMCLHSDGKDYPRDSEFVESKAYLKTGKPWHYTGFDKDAKKSLYVEAKKIRSEPYSLDKELAYHKIQRFSSRLDNIKISVIRWAMMILDGLYWGAKRVGIRRIFNR